MNIENITYMIDALEAIPDNRFTMSKFDNNYEREHDPALRFAGCLGGWTEHLLHQPIEKAFDINNMFGLRMTLPTCWNIDSMYTRQDAIDMLNNFLKTGQVIWRTEREFATRQYVEEGYSE